MPEIKIDINELRKRKLFVSTPMYGSMCTGVFCNSMMQLTRLCDQYGIEMQFYVLGNESLIQRARNYCTDVFLRSTCTHMMFIDADIGFDAMDVIAMLAMMSDDSEYDILCGPYPKKCLNNKTTIETEDGIKTISWIVKNKYNGKVKSTDSLGNISWNKITNHWSEKNDNKKDWVSINFSNGKQKSAVITTKDHEIGIIENVLNPKISFIEAHKAKGKFSVLESKIDRSNHSTNVHPLLNKEQLSVLIGASLGDGCITQGYYVCCHGEKQTEYNRYKYSIIGGNFKENSNDDNQSKHTFTNGQTKYLSKILYDENGKKTLKNVIDFVDPIALAFMYMDDGNKYQYPQINDIENEFTWYYDDSGKTYRGKTAIDDDGNVLEGLHRGRKAIAWEPTATIATMSFSLEDNNLLVEHIKKNFDIDCYILGNKENSYYIKFDQNNTLKFHKLIAPYVHETMNYKLHENYKNVEKIKIDNVPLKIGAKEIISTEIYEDKTDSYLYDVEVENNHNLFVNDGILVHNCISYEKILQAVNKGLADENPSNLEKFVGDFVFNPVAIEGKTEFNLLEPMEILEGGTGFMMIRRNTFDRFKEAYPQQSYKPDHARTEDFDGSREIVAYFDCPIDPETKRYLSEDYMFAQWCRKIGLKIWLCPWMKLQHQGSFVFSSSLIETLSAGISPTVQPELLKKKNS